MKIVIIAAAAALLLVGSGTLRADMPDLETGVQIQDGSDPLTVGTMSASTVVDWDNDGNKDLVVGDGDGYVWLFLNQNADNDPVFNGGSKVQASGIDIRVNNAAG